MFIDIISPGIEIKGNIGMAETIYNLVSWLWINPQLPVRIFISLPVICYVPCLMLLDQSVF